MLARLHKCKLREGERAARWTAFVVEFPWNPASRALVSGQPLKTQRIRKGEHKRPPCYICNGVSSRYCACAVHLANDTVTVVATSYVRLVSASSTPVYE